MSELEDMRRILETTEVKLMGDMRRTNDALHFYREKESLLIPNTPVHESWRWFLQEYFIISQLPNAFAHEAMAATTVISNMFLPSLLFVKLASVFDNAVEEYISTNYRSIPRQYNNLGGRLEYLASQNKIIYNKVAGDPLFDFKNKRNILAHRPTEPGTWSTVQASWQDLEDAINCVEGVLLNLGVIGQRPNYQTFAERINDPVPLEKNEVHMTHTYNYGLKEEDNIIILFNHTWDYYKLSWMKMTTNTVFGALPQLPKRKQNKHKPSL